MSKEIKNEVSDMNIMNKIDDFRLNRKARAEKQALENYQDVNAAVSGVFRTKVRVC